MGTRGGLASNRTVPDGGVSSTGPVQNATSILVADGQLLFAESLADALSRRPGFRIVPDRPTRGHDALEAVRRHQPEVVLYDFWLLGVDGPAATRLIHEWAPGTKVLLLSWFHGPSQVHGAVEAGATGFLPKSLSLLQVEHAIRRAVAGDDLVYSEELMGLVDAIEGRAVVSEERWARFSSLTPREVDVLRKLAEGWTGKELARELSIKLGTLKNHIHNILAKTGARSQLEAVTLARHEGLVKDSVPRGPLAKGPGFTALPKSPKRPTPPKKDG